MLKFGDMLSLFLLLIKILPELFIHFLVFRLPHSKVLHQQLDLLDIRLALAELLQLEALLFVLDF